MRVSQYFMCAFCQEKLTWWRLSATSQWFTNLRTIKATALEALKEVTMVPASGKARLEAMLKLREDWCISRQVRCVHMCCRALDVETHYYVMRRNV